MPPYRVLIVDDDEWTRRMVGSMLKNERYQVLAASDGEEGFAVAQLHRPDLILLDVLMPKMDGWTLIKQLRALPEFAFVPVIFLTTQDTAADRIRGFRLGADDYLPKPFRTEELLVRVEASLKRRADIETHLRRQARAARAGPGFSGSLQQVGLPSLLTVLEMERKTGVLILQGSELGQAARIFLREGRVVQANIDDGSEFRNADAIYHLLGWSSGSFDFTGVPVELPDEMHLSTTLLLMEGARRMDEMARR